ncbi:galactonate dehydratase [Nonomuraea sp. KC401]|uniref:galactonate dehydratase n=1 Tax=unclassified Nonomuraea TaxID=2593643 RepID=UPI0010FD5665|nr:MULTISPECIES: galactonate dehydratase [unclassified Nonomuraea]NBE92608.1 galactonate dehydratase [Nonomuraea sp. K271]TLF84563.1 galactonate dehydratase [Nonomuraea sp. KC401]
MRIVSLTTYLVAPRWLFLRVDTDEGITGWGEPVIEGRAATVAAAVAELSDHLVGADPLRIEDHWQVLTKGGFYRGGPVLSSAVAGIDQALWDIAGKAYGVPVHRLLGGPVRERVRVYGWVGGDSPAEASDAAVGLVEGGFTALKMNAAGILRAIDTAASVKAIVDRLASVRAAVGDEVDIALDFHGRLSLPMARRVLPLLEPYLPFFVEEPVVPELTAELAAVTSATSIPIAAGERLYSRWEFRPALEAGIAVAQPDVSHAGGISEIRRIAALAEVYGAAVAPHCPLGPIALAASLQTGFATPNLLIQEQSLGLHYNEPADLLDYLVDPSVFRYADGHVPLPTGPGLGIEIDAAAVERAAEIGHRWRSPIWRRDDGGLAEW